jgi:UMF1 family MFS transporter
MAGVSVYTVSSMSQEAGATQQKIYTRQSVSWALFDFSTTVFAMNVISRFAALWIKNEKHGTDLDFAWAIVASLLAASVVNVVLAPLSDALGRRAMFVRVFALLCAVATATLGTNPALPAALALIALANFANQSGMIFWTAMLGDVSTPRSLGRISGLGAALSYIGSVTGLMLAERLRDEQASAAVVFVPTALVYVLFALPQFLLVRDRQPREAIDVAATLRATWAELAEMGRLIWNHRPLRWFMVAVLLYSDVLGTLTLFMAVYAQEAIGMDEQEKVFLWLSEISVYLIAATVFAVAGGWLFGKLADRLNKLRLLMSVLALWTAGLLIAILARAKWPFWIAGPMIGLAWGGVAVLGRALLLELGWPEHRTKLFTLFALVGRAAGIIGPLLWGVVVKLAAPLGHDRYRLAAGTLAVLMFVAMWILQKAIREQKAMDGKKA